jgi:hypothetical protein
MHQLAQVVEAKFTKTANDVEEQVEGCRALVENTTPQKAHYFRGQIVKLARQRGYWADLREPWDWVRLQLRDGGITDLVVVLHFIGNPSPGACVALAFLGHRATKEDEAFTEITSVETETMVLYPAEEPAAQTARFEAWLEQVLKTSLAIWIKYL